MQRSLQVLATCVMTALIILGGCSSRSSAPDDVETESERVERIRRMSKNLPPSQRPPEAKETSTPK